jgi:hypothetical protein
MKPLRAALLTGLFCTAFSQAALASDHTDSPAISQDPTADITDLFAFKSPERSGHLVLVMNVHPGAFKDAKFSDAVTYSIRVRSESKTNDREVRIDCTFDAAAEQHGSCTAYAFVPSTKRLLGKVESGPFTVGAVGKEKDGMRIFTGLRADPFYIDAKGAPAGIRGDKFAFTGDNALKGLDVLSIVVDVDVRKVFAALGSSGALRVAAETTIGGKQ